MAATSLSLIILLSIAVLCKDGVIGEECVSGRSNYPSFSPEVANSLPYDRLAGYQVILPGLKFHCHGKILEWSALTVYRNNSGSSANHLAYFQVWRPNGTGRYVRVGYDEISVTHTELQPITSARPRDDSLLYFNLSGLVEDRTEDRDNNMDSEENKPLYFQPGDVVGFNIQRLGVKRPLYMTHHSPTDEDSEQLAMDLFYTTTTGLNQQCQMSECSEEVRKLSSVIPHIHFTYEEVSPDDEAFQQQLLSTEECETPIVELAECPTLPIPTPSSSNVTTRLTDVGITNSTVPTGEGSSALSLYVSVGVGVAVVVLIATAVTVVSVSVCLRKRKNKHVNTTDNVAYHCSSKQVMMNVNEIYTEISDLNIATSTKDAYGISHGASDVTPSQNEDNPVNGVAHQPSGNGVRMKINEAYGSVNVTAQTDKTELKTSVNVAYLAVCEL